MILNTYVHYYYDITQFMALMYYLSVLDCDERTELLYFSMSYTGRSGT